MRPISAQGMTISTAITLYHEKPVLQNSRTSPKLKKTWKTAKAADRLGCILDSGGDVRAHDHRRTREEERE